MFALTSFQVIREVFSKAVPETLSVGQEVSGVVTKIGPSVTTVKEGDEVVGKSINQT